jgi:hypothetical protein
MQRTLDSVKLQVGSRVGVLRCHVSGLLRFDTDF